MINSCGVYAPRLVAEKHFADRHFVDTAFHRHAVARLTVSWSTRFFFDQMSVGQMFFDQKTRKRRFMSTFRTAATGSTKRPLDEMSGRQIFLKDTAESLT